MSQSEESNKAISAPATKAHTVTFKTPIKRGEQLINEVTLRVPKAGDLRGLKMMDVMQLETSSVATVVTRISSPPLLDHEVMSLSWPDLSALGLEMMGFFEAPEISPS